jgi:hypothetical protein
MVSWSRRLQLRAPLTPRHSARQNCRSALFRWGIIGFAMPDRFFDPLPPRDEPEASPWGPPLWDRPSEGTLGTLVPVDEVLHSDDKRLVAVDHLRAYPNGFTIEFLAMRNPNDVHRDRVRSALGSPRNWPRVGVRFADGRTAGQHSPTLGSPGGPPKDAAGSPTVPVLRFTGGGGGGSVYRFSAWVFPLPPPGPLSIFVEARDIPETSVTIEGELIRDAATRARIVWS